MFSLNDSSVDSARKHVNLTDIGLSWSGVCVLRIYSTLILIIGVFGNIVVLTGLFQTFINKIDTVSKVFLQNLFVTDGFYALVHFTPIATVLFINRWPFGPVLCNLQQILSTIFAINEIHIITILSCHRLWLLHRPLRTSRIKRKKVARILVLIVFSHDVLLHIIYHMVPGVQVGFQPQVLSCVTLSEYTSPWARVSMAIYNIILPIVLTTTVNSISLFQIIRVTGQKRGRISKPYTKATVTILAISLVFLVSYLPYFIKMFLHRIPYWYSLTSMYFLSISIILNPFLYAILDREFQIWLKDQVLLFILKILSGIEWAYERCYGSFDENLNETTHFQSLESARPIRHDL